MTTTRRQSAGIPINHILAVKLIFQYGRTEQRLLFGTTGRKRQAMRKISIAAAAFVLLASSHPLSAETAASPPIAPAPDALPKLGLTLVAAMPHDGNAVVSPFSFGAALDLIAIGGNDAVRASVANATGIGASTSSTLSALDRRMVSSARSGGISLEVANAIWPDSSVQLAPGFIEAEQRDADAPAKRLDLTSDAAKRTINDWVAHATHGHIPALLDGPPSDTRTAVSVTNALYFKGAWKDPFDRQLTARQPFHRQGAPDTIIDLMSQEDLFSYRDEAEFQAVELYFGNNAGFALEVVLPKRADIDPATLVESAGARFLDALQGNGHQNVRGTVMLPHLDISQTLHPIELMTNSEVVGAIRQPEALDRMFAAPPKDLGLKSIQKVVMKLDEEGATAAAATGTEVSSAAMAVPLPVPPFEFRADHPFWFALRDRTSGTVLMMGIVRQP